MQVVALKRSRWAITVTVLSAILLPQLFHVAGIFLNLKVPLGSIFLPMYLPVIIATLYYGKKVAMISGFISPLISYSIFSMPNITTLPFIMIELVVLAFLLGSLSKKIPLFLRILTTLIVTRFIFALMVGSLTFVLNSIPGIILQLVMVPIIFGFIDE